jgi:hypothetical protein
MDYILERIQRMTPHEHFESLVRVGIYNDAGELTKEYGGTADPSPHRRTLPSEQ